MRRLKRAAAALIAYGPAYSLLKMNALRRNSLVILCYHTLSADQGGPEAWTSLRVSDFRNQIETIGASHKIVSLAEALATPAATEPRAVITFDDGDVGLYRHLMPILRETKLPVTLYIATSQIESGKPYWFDRLMNGLAGCKADVITLEDQGWAIPASVGAPRWPVISSILEYVKTCRPSDRDSLVDHILEQVDCPDFPGEQLGPMRAQQLRDLAQIPGVTIGAHSHGHELLDQIPLADAMRSAAHSRHLLEDWTGVSVRDFAYPNGNHNSDLQNGLREEGFRSAVVLDNARVDRRGSAFALSRLAIGRYETKMRFRLRLMGL